MHLANIFCKWKTARPNFFHCLFAIFCCCSLCIFDKHCKSILLYVYSAGQFPFVPSCLTNDEIEVFSLFFSANFGYSVSPPYFLIETHFSLVTSRNSDEIYFHLGNGEINVLQKSYTSLVSFINPTKWNGRGEAKNLNCFTAIQSHLSIDKFRWIHYIRTVTVFVSSVCLPTVIW